MNCSTMTEVAAGAGRGHLAQALHFAKLPFQRRRHRGSHHVRAGAGIKRQHLDGRVVDLRQRGDRQLRVGDDATSMIAAISSEVATGRRINGRDGLTELSLPLVVAGSSCLGDRDLGAVLQLFKAAVGHDISGIEPLDRGLAGLAKPPA